MHRPVTFVLPSTDVIPKILELGVAVEAPVREDRPGQLTLELVVNAEEQRQLEELGLVPLEQAGGGGADGLQPAKGTKSPAAASKGSPAAERSETSGGIAAAGPAASETDQVRILRAETFENYAGSFLSIEARSSAGDVSGVTLEVYDGATGERIGTLSRYVDAGQYMYHRLLTKVERVPQTVRVVSNLGGSAEQEVSRWPSQEARFSFDGAYRTGFVDHYMDPTEVYARLEALAAQFPQLSEIIELPYKTNGYRRKAMAVTGATASRAIVWYSKAWGHEGGNDLRVHLVDPGAPARPLEITYDPASHTVRVSLATDATGRVVSTAGDVIAAVNANSGLPVTAFNYRGATPNGIVEPEGPVQLSDFLNAPAHVSREPFTVKAIRIGKRRDGSRTGVFIYAQEHAREWVTPLVALETAARLLHNYATHKPTRELVDNLDIFILPSVNPDGAHYSFYDYNMQRKNLVNHGGPEVSDPARRNQWGVDINRNFAVGSVHDGYSGGSTDPLSQTYAGPAPLSEPEARNEVWLVERFPNIKFSMNVHSYGGYFMWAPGGYRVPGRVTLPRPTLGQETYFWQVGERILSAIERWRDTVILPSRTGPVVDVLYSAGGNSADHFWYKYGIFAWDFEVGVDRFESGRWQPMGFQPPWPEAYDQAMEFAHGTMELLRVALDYQNDRQRPKSSVELIPEEGTRSAAVALGAKSPLVLSFEDDSEQTLVYTGPVRLRFRTSEPADVYYTLDGSRPTFESSRYEAAGVRDRPQEIRIEKTTEVAFFAVDMKGLVEKNYKPDGKGKNYNKLRIVIQPPVEGTDSASLSPGANKAHSGQAERVLAAVRR
ncbi:MAG: zinc carboxypeptidase [Bacillota bacterium]|nr:MAG: zinc carboxypeptidase [Bacillota bacterium]